MRIDAVTPCPACAIQVRALYDSAMVLVLMLEHRQEQAGDVSAGVLSSVADLRLMLDLLTPWVEAHRANQVHAYSIELVHARNPVLEAEIGRLAPIDARD